MLKIKPFLGRIPAGTAMLLALCVVAVRANVPRGWHLAGSNPTGFEVGVDADQNYQSRASAFLKSKQSSVEGFGTLMQTVQAEQYKGKKVRLSGLVKSQDVAGWAGLWMRVDQGKDVVALDNMENRAIKGTSAWQRYNVVLEVPKDATGISFGILLAGGGEVWLNNTKFDVVAADISVTTVPDKPVNLEFTE